MERAGAKQAASVEELLALAKAHGIKLEAQEAAKLFASLHTQGELTEEELNEVAGGRWPREGISKDC